MKNRNLTHTIGETSWRGFISKLEYNAAEKKREAGPVVRQLEDQLSLRAKCRSLNVSGNVLKKKA